MEYEDIRHNYNYNQMIENHKIDIIELFFL